MQPVFLYKRIFVLALISFLVSSGTSGFAQDQQYKRFLGKWVTGPTRENYLKMDDNQIQVSFIIQDVDGYLFVQMKSPDADAFNMPADEAISTGEKIKIYFEPLNAVFKGEINRANNLITGSLGFLGRTFPMSLVKIIQE
jgi:hypothetical protein